MTINGANFKAPTVKFNGVTATTVKVVSSVRIKATVPAGASTGLIEVATSGGTATSAAPFTVTARLTSGSVTLAQAPNTEPVSAPSSKATALQPSPVTLSTATVQAAGNKLELNFGGALDAAVATDVTHYTVEINGEVVAVEAATYDAGLSRVTLSLQTVVLKAGDQVVIIWQDLLDTKNRVVSGRVGPLVVR